MRGTLAYVLFGGHLWIAANILLLCVIAVEFRRLLTRNRAVARITHFTLVLALGLAGVGAAPVPTWLLLSWGAAVVAYLAFGFDTLSRHRPRIAALTLMIVAVATAAELRYFLVRPGQLPPRTLLVIGDSLSSGGFGEREPWPATLARRWNAELVNVSRPSETLEEVSQSIEEITERVGSGTLVLVQVGGNDMLEGRSTREFERDLRRVVRAARLGDSPVVILELPSLPLRSGYPAAQRRVAAMDGVSILPRRVLLSSLTCSGCVSDGLHLTDRGHARLADALYARWARPGPGGD